MGLFDRIKSIFHRNKPTPPPVVPDPVIPPAPEPNLGLVKETLLDLHNKFRDFNHKMPLTVSDKLNVAAQLWAAWMASHRIMEHEAQGYTVQGRIEATGFKPWLILAENIEMGSTDPNKVMDKWTHSAPHRANILSNSNQVGFGVARDINGLLYWCVDFGTQQDTTSALLDLLSQRSISLGGTVFLDSKAFDQ